MIFNLIGGYMDLLNDLTNIWVDVVSVFLMLSFLVCIGYLLWQHWKNKREQEAIIAQYNQNLKILNDLKNRF